MPAKTNYLLHTVTTVDQVHMHTEQFESYNDLRSFVDIEYEDHDIVSYLVTVLVLD